MSTNPRDISSFVNYWGNRSNYKKVTIDSAIDVTGRVMPVRDIDDASAPSYSTPTARVIRGEDAAWLVENTDAVNDIVYLGASGKPAISTSIGIEIDDAHLSECSSSHAGFFDNSAHFQFVSGVFNNGNDGILGQSFMETRAKDAVENEKKIQCDWLNSIGRDVVSDDVRRIFFTFKKIKWIECKDFFKFWGDIQGVVCSPYRWPSLTNHGFDNDLRPEITHYDYYNFTAYRMPVGLPQYHGHAVADGDLMFKFDSTLTSKIKNVYAIMDFVLNAHNVEQTSVEDLYYYFPIQVKMSYVKMEDGSEIWKLPDSMKDTRDIENMMISHCPSFNGNYWPGIRYSYSSFNNCCIIELDLDSDLTGIGWSFQPS